MEQFEIVPWMGLRYVSHKDKRGRNQLKLASKSNPLFWWKEHNDVKHQRLDVSSKPHNDYFDKANLKNAIYSFGALYILEMTLLQNVGTKNELEAFLNDGKLFRPRLQFATSADIDNMINDLF